VLPVTVTDREGRLVPDLEPTHFTVYDNGRAQAIAAFSRDDAPVSIALVIDNSGSMRPKLGEVMAAALAFARESHPEDDLRIVEFNDRVRDPLEGATVGASDMRGLEAALRTLRPEGQTALYDALLYGLEQLDDTSHARRVLVLMSDGADNASRATLDLVLDRARRSDVTIYTIGLFDADARDRNPGVLAALAKATGGERFLPKSPGPLLAACQRIAREIRSSYTIGFTPPERDGRYHGVRVELTGEARRGRRVRTRPGYVSGLQD